MQPLSLSPVRAQAIPNTFLATTEAMSRTSLPPPLTHGVGSDTSDILSLLERLTIERRQESHGVMGQQIKAQREAEVEKLRQYLSALERMREEGGASGGLFDSLTNMISSVCECLAEMRLGDAALEVCEGSSNLVSELGKDLESLAKHPEKWATVVSAAAVGFALGGPLGALYVLDHPDSAVTKTLSALGQAAAAGATFGGTTWITALSLSLQSTSLALDVSGAAKKYEWARYVSVGAMVGTTAVGIFGAPSGPLARDLKIMGAIHGGLRGVGAGYETKMRAEQLDRESDAANAKWQLGTATRNVERMTETLATEMKGTERASALGQELVMSARSLAEQLASRKLTEHP